MGNWLILGKGLAGGQLHGSTCVGEGHKAAVTLLTEIGKSKTARKSAKKQTLKKEVNGFI